MQLFTEDNKIRLQKSGYNLRGNLRGWSFPELERPGNIKAEKDITVGPVVFGIGEEGPFIHSFGVGEMQLEYMASGLKIKTQGERVMYPGGFLLVDDVMIIDIK